MKDLISVILPVYKVENYLTQCLNSVINQTYKNLEIIVVNDGSPDNSEKIILNLAKKDKRIKYIKQKNGGLSVARNVGINASTGKYIFFLDSDDFMAYNTISNLHNQIIKTNSELAICNHKKVKEQKKYNINLKLNKKYKTQILNAEQSIKNMLTSNDLTCAVAWGKLYKSNFIKNNKISFNEMAKYGEDSYFNYQYYKLCNKICLISFKGIYYVQRKSSLVHAKFNKNALTALIDNDKIFNDINQNNPNLLIYAQTWRFYQNLDIQFKMWKSKYVNEQENLMIVNNLKRDAKDLKKNKDIVLHRRVLAPFAFKLMKNSMLKRLKKF